MKAPASLFARSLAVLLMTLFAVSPGWAPETYPVPWKVHDAKTPPAKGLVLYWFPASKEEIQKSSLRMSRTLSLYASQCISMELADTRLENADKLLGDSKLPVAVVATPDG